jgi:hypothetical protein
MSPCHANHGEVALAVQLAFNLHPVP